MTTPIYIIYKITNTINNKSYIGQTVTTIHKRWIKHKSSAKINKVNNYFHNAISKYDESIWNKSVIFTCFDRDFLNEAEELLISDYDTFHNGYNSTSGGDSPSERLSGELSPLYGIPRDEETKKKLSESKKGIKNPSFKGYHITPFGKLDSYRNIKLYTDLISPITINIWCKNANKLININSFRQSKYLKTLGKGVIVRRYNKIYIGYEDQNG